MIIGTRNQKRCALFLALGALLATSATAAVQLGIDVLAADDYAPLAGKRVGLITNQTGVDSSGTKTRLLLKRNCNLVALYSPEHGLDGTQLAGRYVPSRRDSLTGVPVHSLYGPTRKPTPAMLRGIDVLVFDLQDIGCRSYTYISTMGRCMEAAGENNLPFIVLDRPNPLGGNRVEGPSVEPQWISFVSQFPIPYVHGLTVGELAKMVNARGMNATRCALTVIPMRGWSRGMTWNETGLRWIPSSPNIPHGSSPLYYVATGMLGELSGPETGIGGPAPFESASTSWLEAGRFTDYLRALDAPGVTFREYHAGRQQGASLRIEPDAATNLTGLNIYLLAEMNRHAHPDLFRRSSHSKLDIFYKVYGSTSIRTALERGASPQSIISGWRENVAAFRLARSPFLLY